jgi:hypothetical protein
VAVATETRRKLGEVKPRSSYGFNVLMSGEYPGSHEHLAVDIDVSVDEAGGLRLRSGASGSMKA